MILLSYELQWSLYFDRSERVLDPEAGGHRRDCSDRMEKSRRGLGHPPRLWMRMSPHPIASQKKTLMSLKQLPLLTFRDTHGYQARRHSTIDVPGPTSFHFLTFPSLTSRIQRQPVMLSKSGSHCLSVHTKKVPLSDDECWNTEPKSVRIRSLIL